MMKAVMFDFDGTLSCESNGWAEIWRFIGKEDKDKELYQRFDNNEFTYLEWCAEVCQEFKAGGVTKDLLPHIASQIKIIDGAHETFKALKNAGFSLNIVSGGIKHMIVGAVGQDVKYFDNISANEFIFDENGILQSFALTKYDYEGKAQFIKEFSAKTGIPTRNIWFVGDSYNDEFVYTSGCHTICINPNYDVSKGKVWNEVIKKVDNLSQILPYITKQNELVL